MLFWWCGDLTTLCEELQGPDFLTHAELQDLLQDVLPLGLLHDPHSLQLPVRQSHQGAAWRQGWREREGQEEV